MGRLRRSLSAALPAVLLCGLCSASALAVTAGATLEGSVYAAGAPVPNAKVRASGNNAVFETTAGTKGEFVFTSIPLGSYDVEAVFGELQARETVDLGSGGASTKLVLEPLKQITAVSALRSATARGSGSDVTLNAAALTRLPNDNSFPEMMVQLPGAVRGANGVVHLNGDHGVINYQIDGVALPQALNRDIGSELNLNDIAFADVVEGAYPAQYGLKFGSVLNLSTRSGVGPGGFDGNASAGSYGGLYENFGCHHALPGGGGESFAIGSRRTNRGLDPPNFDSPHNEASKTNQFARLTLSSKGQSFTNITVIHSYATFQIPNDVPGGEPAATDDSETQEDAFVNVQFRRAFGGSGVLTYGPALKISKIRDYGDPANDFAYGEAINARNGGSSMDCANAIASRTYGVTTCRFSLADLRTAADFIAQADYARERGRNSVRSGVSLDLSKVDKHYAVTLQPNNFLAPILTPLAPNAPVTVTDGDPNIATTYQSYVQDSWRIDDRYEADFGLRYDFFTIGSAGFREGFGAFSPRLKVARIFSPRANAYAYAGRFFEPFSFENVGPRAAQLLNLPLQSTLAQFDLKPERDTQLELGGHIPLGAGSLGVRVWQKNANDLIDDTQVGVTLLHQDINYTLGRLSQQAMNYVQPLQRNGRAYFSFAHTVSVNKGCETQLLAPCFGSPTDFTPADHDQTYSIASGVLANDDHGGWLSFDGEYGSGLSSGICPAGTRGYCKRTPHTIFNFGRGIGIGNHTAITVNVQNLLNDRYYVTLLNAQGTHYAAPRTVDVGVRFGEP